MRPIQTIAVTTLPFVICSCGNVHTRACGRATSRSSIKASSLFLFCNGTSPLLGRWIFDGS